MGGVRKTPFTKSIGAVFLFLAFDVALPLVQVDDDSYDEYCFPTGYGNSKCELFLKEQSIMLWYFLGGLC